jgi:hypothetical protein
MVRQKQGHGKRACVCYLNEAKRKIDAALTALRFDLANGNEVEDETTLTTCLDLIENLAKIGALVQPPTQEGETLASAARVDG